MNRFVPYLVLALLGFCLGAHAQPAGKQPTPARENRFLFVLETSAATKRLADAYQRTVVQLLSDEVASQLKPGDSFSIWTYNESLSAGRFPAQRWNPETRRTTLRQVTNFLANVKYEKAGRFDVLKPALESLTKNSPKLTVILLTDGKQRVSGLKFDGEINTLFNDNYSAMRDAKMPFVTILVARNGEPVAFSVNSTLGPIKYPPPPHVAESASETARVQPETSEPPKTIPAVTAPKESTPATTTSTPAPAPAPPIIAPDPAKPAPVNPPTVTIQTAAPISPDPKPTSQAPVPPPSTKVIEPAPVAAAQSLLPPIMKPAAGETQTLPTPPPTISIATEKASESTGPVVVSSPTKTPTDPSLTKESSTTNKTEPVKLAQPAIAVINPVEITTGRRSFLGTALALVVVAIFLGYLLLRPKRDPSLITKSIHRLPK